MASVKETLETVLSASKVVRDAGAQVREAVVDAVEIVRERSPSNTGATGLDVAFDAAEAGVAAVERVEGAVQQAAFSVGVAAITSATALDVDPAAVAASAKKGARRAMSLASKIMARSSVAENKTRPKKKARVKRK